MDGPHLRRTMDRPHSSYSCLEIHICWKVEREAKMEPPIQTEYFLSGGAMILILMVDGAKAVISLHTVSNTRVHGGATRHDGVGIKILPDVNIALHDGVVGGLMDAAGLHAKEGRLEEGLRGTEPLITNGNDLAIGKFIRLLEGGGGSSGGHLLLEVKGNIAELLLDVTDNLTLSGGGERVASLGEDLHQVVGELTASQVQTEDGMGESITFINGDSVRNTIT